MTLAVSTIYCLPFTIHRLLFTPGSYLLTPCPELVEGLTTFLFFTQEENLFDSAWPSDT